MDSFELYIYSLRIFSLNASFLLARVIVIAVLVAILSLIGRVFIKKWKPSSRWAALGGCIVVSSLFVFAVSPPDNLTSAYHSEPNLQMTLFGELLHEPPLDSLNLHEGKQVVCFFTTGCETCQLAARKFSLMQQRYGFPNDRITCVFMDDKESIAQFYADAHTPAYRFVQFDDVVKMVKAIRGQFPTLVLLENGAVVHTYSYRDMKEAEIKVFFTQP